MASVAAPTNTTLPAVATPPIGLDAKPTSAPIYQAPPTPPLSDDEREAAKASTKSEPIVVDDASSAAPSAPTFERRMGDTELSYYLPSRADGVNDMYVPRHSQPPAKLHTLTPPLWLSFLLSLGISISGSAPHCASSPRSASVRPGLCSACSTHPSRRASSFVHGSIRMCGSHIPRR